MAKPLLLAGLVTQPRTWAVTSMVMYCPAAGTGTAATLPAPDVLGTVAAVTPASDQALVTVCASMAPAVPTRLTNSTRLALATLAAVVAAGSGDRSKRSSPTAPPPTLIVGRLPKLVLGRLALTWASAATGASSAQPGRASSNASPATGQRGARRQKFSFNVIAAPFVAR